MTEPGDPRPEYKLSDEDFELIKLVDFRFNNVMLRLLGTLERVREDGSPNWSDDKYRALRSFFQERHRAIRDNRAKIVRSGEPTLLQLVVNLDAISNRIISLAGAISHYLTNHNRDWLCDSVNTCYQQMKPIADGVKRNRAYRAYRARIEQQQLEAGRTTFVYEDRRSGE